MKQLVYVAALIALVCCGPVSAEELGTIKATVLMADGKTPAAHVYVKIVHVPTGHWVATSKTDATGEFTTLGMPAGPCKIIGPDGSVADTRVNGDAVAKVTLKLRPDVMEQGHRRGGTNRKVLGVSMLGAFAAGCVVVVSILIIFG